MSISRLVADVREERGLSQTAFANAMQAAGAAHWRQTTVSRVEAGTQRLTLTDAVVLCQVLGLSLTGLAKEVAEPDSDPTSTAYAAGYKAGVAAARAALDRLDPTG